MMYEICENCGAHLDHGERCDCEKKKAPTAATARTSELNMTSKHIITHIHNTTKEKDCQVPYKKEIDDIFKGMNGAREAEV